MNHPMKTEQSDNIWRFNELQNGKGNKKKKKKKKTMNKFGLKLNDWPDPLLYYVSTYSLKK